MKLVKSSIISRIHRLDEEADGLGLDEDGWALCYFLEDQLVEILSTKEEYLKQHGRQQWTL
jgi:hypothetical protein